MRTVIKHLAGVVLIPLTKWYLSKERAYNKDGIQIRIMPGVFHPGLFSSTSLLLELLREQDLKGHTLLELGCGSGFLSIAAAKKDARVTSSDINPRAIENTRINAEANDAHLEIIKSDLFADLPGRSFDWIIINPPFYAKTPTNNADLAWYCGENFEYFEKLFTQLRFHRNSKIIMVLTLECDLRQIFAIAEKNGFKLESIREKRSFFDGKNLLYKIQPVN